MLTKTKKLRLAPTNKTYCEIGRAKVRIYYSQCKQLRNIILYGSNIPSKGWKLVDKNYLRLKPLDRSVGMQ